MRGLLAQRGEPMDDTATRGERGAAIFDFDHTLGVDHRLEESVMRDLSGRYCGSPFSDEGIAASLARFRTGSVGLAGMLDAAHPSRQAKAPGRALQPAGITDDDRETKLLQLGPGLDDDLRANAGHVAQG